MLVSALNSIGLLQRSSSMFKEFSLGCLVVGLLSYLKKEKLAEITRCHLLLLVVPLVVNRCHSLSFVVTRCTTRCHSVSLVVTRYTTCLSFCKRSSIRVFPFLYFIFLLKWNKQEIFKRRHKKDQKQLPQPASLLKKRLCHRRFRVNFAKFLRTPFLTEHLQWLLLKDGKKADNIAEKFYWK